MKIAVVGLGPHGKRLLEASLAVSPEAAHALVDKNQEVLSAFSGHATFADYATMLSDFAPDTCIISTNGPSHFELAKMAILGGVKRVLVTKPLTCTLADAYALKQLAEEHGVKLAVDHGLRYDATYRWIREQTENNRWGELLSIHIMRNGIGMGCLGTHSFDLANYLYNQQPLAVSAWIDQPYTRNPRGEQFVDPGGLVVVDYGNDRRAIISQIERASGPMVVQLFYSQTRLTVDVKFGTLEVVEKDPNATPAPNKPVPLERFVNPQGAAVDHHTVHLMESILKNLRSHTPMEADLTHGLTSVELLVAAYQSAENNNTPVSLPVTSEEYINRFLPVT